VDTITSRIRNKLGAGEPIFGAGITWPSPELAELFGQLGFDWLWVDLEHGRFDLNDLAHVVRAAEAAGLFVVGRVPRGDEAQLLRYAETGIEGFLCAHIEAPADIDAVVRTLKYPPVGQRSAGRARTGRPDDVDGPQYYQRINRDLLIIGLVESLPGIKNLQGILAHDQLDGVSIGFADLSFDMGFTGNRDHIEVQTLGGSAARQVVESGKVWQVIADTADEAEQAVEAGALMIRLNARSVLSRAAQGWLDRAKAAEPQRRHTT